MDSSRWRSAVTHFVLGATPPMVRDALLNDPSFLSEHRVRADPTLHIGDGLVVQRSVLYGAIRSVLSTAQPAWFLDSEQRRCRAEPLEGGRAVGGVVLHSGSSRVELLDHGVLSENGDTRLRCFEALSKVVPIDTASSWRTVVASRPLRDDEVCSLILDFADTPLRRMQAIRAASRREGEVEVATLVPRSLRYIERLVGKFDGSTNILDYARGPGRCHFRELLGWDQERGLLDSLLCSAHRSLVSEIDVDQFRPDELMRLLSRVDADGDPVSRIGAIEIGFGLLRKIPEMETVLASLIGRVREDDGRSPESPMRFMWSLFVLVDGELSRAKICSGRPAYYRRLAAMAHAALLYRVFGNTAAEIEKFGDWLVQKGWRRFMVQTLVDTRAEPRWGFDLASPERLRAEALTRIAAVAQPVIQDINNQELRQMVDLSDPGSICRELNWWELCLPGPLDGADGPNQKPPDDFVEEIDEGLAENPTNPAVCVALGHLSRIADCRSQLDRLKNRLEDDDFRFSEIQESKAVLLALFGLAAFSAATRRAPIGDRIEMLVGRYRRDPKYGLSAGETVGIVLAAAASRGDLAEWIEFVGRALTGLAFGDLTDEEGREMGRWLTEICDVVPELWSTCARADAALAAFNERLS